VLAHTSVAVEIAAPGAPPPAKDWAVDGTRGGTGRSRVVNPLGFEKGCGEIDPESFWKRLQAKHERMAGAEVRVETAFTDDAELVVVAFGTAARFARHAVGELRREGARVGFVRPVTLWPFPYEAVAQASRRARRVAVFEQNAGQMIEDVRLGVLGRAPVVGIGGISSDAAGFGVGALLDAEVARERIERALSEAA
jgi:2-oxoglutarate ferredoxin oxidoreductase subunit alpha